MATLEYENRPEDVGQILVQVQDDLQQLKTKLLSQTNSSHDRHFDLTYLENAIKKTEQSIKEKTEEAFNHMNNRVSTMPDFEEKRRNEEFATIETMWDLKKTNQASGKVASEISKAQEKSLFLLDGVQVLGLTPGQQFQQAYNSKIIRNPHNERNRELMNNAYKIQLPLINERKTYKPTLEVVKGSTVVRLAVLPPQANRTDAQVLPSALDENDAKRGIISLVDRGFVPSGAQLALEPAPIRQSLAPIHSADEKQKEKSVSFKDSKIKTSNVKLDASLIDNCQALVPYPTRPRSGNRSGNNIRRIMPAKKTQFRSNRKSVASLNVVDLSLSQPHPPPTTPSSAFEIGDGDAEKQHRFACQHGKVKDKSEEFVAFKQHYCLTWGSVVTMLRHLEKMLSCYSVPIAFINGDKLVDMSYEFELEQSPTVDDLLDVIVNREEVEKLIKKPSNRYRGVKGRELAARKIQATYRMHRDRTAYLEYRRKKWAAGVLAISWIMCVKLCKMRKQLKVKRAEQLEAFKIRSQYLTRNWQKIKSSKRVVVHIPSLGYAERIRQNIKNFDIEQNLQMSRLCDLKDPNVDVIYVSPVAVSDELTQYYSKLVGLKPAVDSGNVDDQSDLQHRYVFIVPDAIKTFQNHNMCLSTLLKYSPRSLNRIKNLISGREAYIVTGVPHIDDLDVADYLGLPIFCPEPELAHLYSTKSGSKRIFNSAGVKTPPGEFDIYSLQQLYESLSQLIIDNVGVSRWLLKIDDEFDGRGIACLDVSKNLKCYAWVVREAERYGDKWMKKWAQESAYLKIFNEMPQFMAEYGQPINIKIYSTWDCYLKAFLSQGGVVEACPPSESVTALTVNMLIEPDGTVSMVSNGDQIHAETEFSAWGLSTPQSSIDPSVLNDAGFKAMEACKARGIVGYVILDFVTFIDPITMKQELWATDLDLKYGDTLSLHNLFEFVTGGRFDERSHFFSIPPLKQDEKKKRRKITVETERPKSTNRYAVLSTRLYHSNLTMVHYSVFFQMCRAHGIGYDIVEKQGTMFTVIDSTRREVLGMVSIGDSLQGVLTNFARNLSVIHQEISAPNLQGNTNFKAAIQDIESIMGITTENIESQKEEENKT